MAFSGCTSLTSVIIPGSVTSIGNKTFYGCSRLSSVTIPNSVTSIGQEAFSYCSRLTSITIPNGVTTIEESAFYHSGLASITIPRNVTKIGAKAFDGIRIPTVVSLVENPFPIVGNSNSNRTFSEYTFNTAKLYVPKGTMDKYKITDGWMDFLNIEEDTTSESTDMEKCATPTIIYNNGILEFSCATEGVEFVSEMRNSADVQRGNANILLLQPPVTTITVYATKEDYSSSDVAIATIRWQNGQPAFEGFSNVTIDSVYDLNGDGKVSTADIQVIINEMKK